VALDHLSDDHTLRTTHTFSAELTESSRPRTLTDQLLGEHATSSPSQQHRQNACQRRRPARSAMAAPIPLDAAVTTATVTPRL
jgi:hypothetical protein